LTFGQQLTYLLSTLVSPFSYAVQLWRIQGGRRYWNCCCRI